MRKIGAASFIALIGILALIPRDRSAPAQAPGPLPDKTLSFRIVFGERQERPEDYSGSLALNQGKVVNIMPWRLFKEDSGEPRWHHGRRTSNTSNLKTNPMPPNLWIPRSASSITFPRE